MVVLVSLATLVSTLLGGLVAMRARDRLHLVLGLAAGLMLGVVAFDLLPETFANSGGDLFGVPQPLLAFAAGFFVLHAVERSVAMHHIAEGHYGEHRHPAVGVGSALALCAHSFMDGLGIGLAFQASHPLGLAVTLAVVGHDFADGLNTFTVARINGVPHRRAVALLVLDAVTPVLGAAATLFFSLSPRVLAIYLGFFAGFLLYLATSDILPEAHSQHPSRLTLACTAAGAAFIWLVVGLS